MRILLLSADQPRHRALAVALKEIGEVFYIAERRPMTLHSPIKQRYFSYVREAEQAVFGEPDIQPDAIIPFGTISHLKPVGTYDRVVVFGTSWIREPFFSVIQDKAINLHAGIAPQYRGSACNFWAEYDRHPDLVGTTSHRLSAGIDSGDIYVWSRAKEDPDPFVRGMSAIRDAHRMLAWVIDRRHDLEPSPQDSSLQIRYSRHADFTDVIAREYLERLGR